MVFPLAGRKAYAAYMDLRHTSVVQRKTALSTVDDLEWDRMERGWVNGNKDFRQRMLDCIREQNPDVLSRVDDAVQKRDLSEESALMLLVQCLSYFELSSIDLADIAKSDPRKFLMAGLLRYHYPVSAAWLIVFVWGITQR